MLTEAETAQLTETYRSVGCKDCNQTGFTGRRPIFEVMPVRSAEMRQAILSQASVDDLNKLAISEGMVSLRQAAVMAVGRGETSLTEALKIMLAE